MQPETSAQYQHRFAQAIREGKAADGLPQERLNVYIRLMRLSEVDPTTAKTHFEEAAAAGGITSASDRFEVQEKDGWDDLTGVMSRQWNHQILSPTYSNLVLGLGGVSSATQLTDARYSSM